MNNLIVFGTCCSILSYIAYMMIKIRIMKGIQRYGMVYGLKSSYTRFSCYDIYMGDNSAWGMFSIFL